MGDDINVFSPGFRYPIFLFTSVIRVYSREKPTHTSNCGVVSASWAGTRRWSSSEAVCESGTWASVINVAVRVLARDFPSPDPILGCPLP